MITKTLHGILTLVAMALLTALISLPAHAGSEDFGDYEVHWSVFSSTLLTPEVAKANNLQLPARLKARFQTTFSR